MITWKQIKNNFRQIFAIAEKNFTMTLRYKVSLIMGYITPIIQLIFPIIIMSKLFSLQENFGPWTNENYLIYLFIGYNILLLYGIVSKISGSLSVEKYWATLQALMIAPFNRLNLFFGYIVSHLIQICVPFTVFLILCYIFFPISFVTMIIIIGMILSILLIFAGISLIIGIFTISNENIARILTFILSFILSFSCISYPYEIFPPFIQFLVNFNPLYYIIDIIRLVWIEDNIYLTLITHPIHFIIFISFGILLPIAGIMMFNYIFKKYGIVGY